jgi:hypothetical protein
VGAKRPGRRAYFLESIVLSSVKREMHACEEVSGLSFWRSQEIGLCARRSAYSSCVPLETRVKWSKTPFEVSVRVGSPVCCPAL